MRAASRGRRARSRRARDIEGWRVDGTGTMMGQLALGWLEIWCRGWSGGLMEHACMALGRWSQ